MSELVSHESFSQTWQQRHRGSVPRKAKTSSKGEYFWIGFWIVVAISAAAFSAAHTIPAAEMTFFKANVNRAELANTAFVMVELVIFGGAAGRRKYRILGWLLVGALLVALAGNVSSTIAAVNENAGNAVNLFGGVLLALLAPLTALVAGEVVHRELDTLAAKRRDAQTAFEAAWREMEAKINAAYSKYEKEYDARQTPDRQPDVSAPALSVQTDSRQTGYGYSRTSDGQQRVVSYLTEHPDEIVLPLRTLAERIGVNKDTVNAGRKAWQERAAVAHRLPEAVAGAVSANGNHRGEE